MPKQLVRRQVAIPRIVKEKEIVQREDPKRVNVPS